MHPLVRLSTFSDKQFENFILEWVHSLKERYTEVHRLGGTGDLGRDIVAWIDPPGVMNRRWDLYQCKHYKNPLTPTRFWVEIGKLCYYTYIREYSLPENYYIVTHKDIGIKLHDLLSKPDKLKKGLVENWDKHCKSKITDRQLIPLDGEFIIYVQNFNFSIFRSVPPLTLIEQHSNTPYHAALFGTPLRERGTPPTPPEAIASSETRYVQQIYEAFSDHLNVEVRDESGFLHRPYLKDAFDHARVCFYSAESLKEFARDQLPNEQPLEDLINQVYSGIRITVNKTHTDGFSRMMEASETATKLQITAHHILSADLSPNDRVGICHHLSNEDKIKWVV